MALMGHQTVSLKFMIIDCALLSMVLYTLPTSANERPKVFNNHDRNLCYLISIKEQGHHPILTRAYQPVDVARVQWEERHVHLKCHHQGCVEAYLVVLLQLAVLMEHQMVS